MSQDDQEESDVRIEETRAEIQEALGRVHDLVSEARRNLGGEYLVPSSRSRSARD